MARCIYSKETSNGRLRTINLKKFDKNSKSEHEIDDFQQMELETDFECNHSQCASFSNRIYFYLKHDCVDEKGVGEKY
jgi:hypothetical protein